MLVSIVFKVGAKENKEIPKTTGNFLHSWFTELINGIDLSLSEILHKPGENKPFTISPLNGKFIPKESTNQVLEGEEYWFRITSIEETLSDILSSLQNMPHNLAINDTEFSFKKIIKTQKDHPWARSESYYEIANKWGESLSDKIKLKFCSPTTFRQKETNLPLPLPILIIKGLYEKWDKYSPFAIKESLEEIANQIFISRYELNTSIFNFGTYKQVGFTGTCEFGIKDKSFYKLIHRLFDFAFYAGVGYKTTMGMGQVRKMAAYMNDPK